MGDHTFISYSHTDQTIVERIIAILQRGNIAVWRDHEQIPVGTPDWEQSIRRGITMAQGVIYAASEDAAKSEYVRHELLIARDNGIPIYPLWIAGAKWSDCVPFGYASIQHADGRRDLEAAVKSVLTQGRNANATVTDPGQERMRRLPVYLLADCSGSMAGSPIMAVNEGIELLCKELMSDPHSRVVVWISIITFADTAVQYPLLPIAQFQPPTLLAGGAGVLGGALQLLADSIEQDLLLPSPGQFGYERPLVFLLSDGEFTDNIGLQVARLKSFSDNLSPNIVAITPGSNADVKALRQITDNVYTMADISGQQHTWPF